MSENKKKSSFKGFFASLGILAILGSTFGGYLYFKDNLSAGLSDTGLNNGKTALAATNEPAVSFNPSDCATYAANGGTNIGGVCYIKLYDKGGLGLFKNITAIPNETVIVRNYYNNTTTSSATAVNISDSIPNGYAKVNPIANLYADEQNWALLNDNVFSGQSLSVAPGAGYFGYATDNSLTSSNLELGRKKYYYHGDCVYNSDSAAYYDPYGAGNDPNRPVCGTQGFGGMALALPPDDIPVDWSRPGYVTVASITGKRYYYHSTCTGSMGPLSGASGYNYRSMLAGNSPSSPDCYYFAGNSGFPTNTGKAVDLLGNRYYYHGRCPNGVSHAVPFYYDPYGAGNDPNPPICGTQGYGGGGNNVRAIDLSDTARGYGFIQYEMRPTNPSGLITGQTFGTIGSMVGTTNSVQNFTSDRTGSITITNGINIPIPISNGFILSLQSCNPPYPTPLTQGNGTVSCVLKLADNTTSEYIWPTIPIAFKIDNSTATITCSLASSSNCLIDQSADTLTVYNIPTTDSSLGSQPLNVSTDGTTFTPFNNAAFIIRPIANNDILGSTLSCTPTSVTVGGTTDCTITLSGTNTFVNKTGSLEFKIGDFGSVRSCNIPTSGNTLTCTGVTVGNTPTNGTPLISQVRVSGTGDPYLTGNGITVNALTTPITNTTITSSTLQSCTPAYPTPVNQGVTNVSCTLKLPSNTTTQYIWPTAPITFKIDNSTATKTCSLASQSGCLIDQSADIVVVDSIPTTGSSLGSQPLNVSTDGTTFTPFNNAVFIVRQIVYADIFGLSLSCTPSTVTVGGTTNCTVTLSGTNTFVNKTGSLEFKIGDFGNFKSCNIPTLGNTLTCNDVTVGNTPTNGTPLISQVRVTGTVDPSITGNGITVNALTTPLTPADIPGLTVTCPSSAVNSVTTCTFPLPSNKTLPTDFKLTIGTGSVNQTTGSAQSCTVTTNTVTCTNVPTGNSVGVISIFGQLTSTAGSKTATGESVAIRGINFGAVSWVFNPDQGSTSPLFRSSDNTSITINNLRTIFDSTPSSNTRYTCTLEYRNFNDRLVTTPIWNTISSTPVAYNTTSGCVFNITKNQRGNVLSQSLRLTITDTSITTPSTSNPNTYTFYNEYLFRFLGAGVASGG